MKNLLFVLLILTIGFNTLYAQGEQSASLIKEFNVNTIEAFFFEPNVTQDSSLVTIENFNKEGRRTKIEIYDSLGLTNHYEYYYQLDTIKTERRTFFKNELVSLTELKYNKYGNEISAIEYDSSGVELGMSSVNTYNDKQQLVDLKVYDDGRIIFQFRQ